jgi:hypothetical protein
VSKLSRRKYLIALGTLVTSYGPLGDGVGQILRGMMGTSAQAQEQSDTVNYIHLMMVGGPPRWTFDLPLRMSAKDSFFPNPMVKTSLADKIVQDYRDHEMLYATTDTGKYLMPWLWSTDFVNGEKMSTLLTHMLTFRGINTGTDGHPINRKKNIAPVPGGYSLNGMVASASERYLPAVDLQSQNEAYRSPNNTSLISINNTLQDPLGQLMGPFKKNKPDDHIRVKSEASRQLINDALDLYQSYMAEVASELSPDMRPIYRNRKNAEQLLKKGVDGLTEVYQQKYQNYRDVINQNMRAPIEGITNRPVLGPQFSNSQTIKSQQLHRNFFWDLGNNLCHIGNEDVRECFSTVTNDFLASHLAVTEFLIDEKLSSAISFNAGVLGDLNTSHGVLLNPGIVAALNNKNQNANQLTANFTNTNHRLPHDMHLIGPLMMLISQSLYFKGLASGLMTLVNHLKEKNVFDKTVIHLAGDFSRTPRTDGLGSDHGWMANCTSVLSGQIKEHLVLGNIYDQSPKQNERRNYGGTFGEGAPHAELDGKTLTPGHVASSIAELLKVPSPKSNEASLIKVTVQGITPLVGAKTIEAKTL